MFAIHVFNVGLGDSIILETKIDDKFYYSIIDCKKVGSTSPVVKFLKENNIKNIHSLFLTHFHADHCSGLPQLRDYLLENKGTLEFFISPYLPDELELKKRLWSILYNDSTRAQRKDIIEALGDIKKLSSRGHDDKKVFPVRILYEGNKTPSAWQSHLHPGLLFAPLNPTSQEAFQYLNSVISKAELGGQAINSLSHAFIVQYNSSTDAAPGVDVGAAPQNTAIAIAAFTGDLEGKAWRTVKNRCLGITQNAVKSRLRFLKVSHHGALNPCMEEIMAEMIDPQTKFVASISCPPGKIEHPHERTLKFLKTQFPHCEIACTNITSYCYTHGHPCIPQSLLQQTEKDIDFIECAMSGQPLNTPMTQPGACAGDHTFTIAGIADHEYTLERSTGLPCAL